MNNIKIAVLLNLFFTWPFQFLSDIGDICDQEEHLVSYAIECDVFFYLRTSIIANAIFHEEVIIIKI